MKTIRSKILIAFVCLLFVSACASTGGVGSRNSVGESYRGLILGWNAAVSITTNFGKLAIKLQKACTTEPDGPSCKTGNAMADAYEHKIQPAFVKAETAVDAAGTAVGVYLEITDPTESDLKNAVDALARAGADINALKAFIDLFQTLSTNGAALLEPAGISATGAAVNYAELPPAFKPEGR